MTSDTSRALSEVAAGRGDIALNANIPPRIAALKTRYASQLHFNPQAATTFFFMNVRRRPSMTFASAVP
jgi:hypothetical protein